MTLLAGAAFEAVAAASDDDGHIADDAAGDPTRIPRLEADRTILGHRKCVYDAWSRPAAKPPTGSIAWAR